MSESGPGRVPDNKILVYRLSDDVEAADWIRPGRPTRQWMDRTPARYAYRCIPLSAANSMGWEILNPVTCEFRWNGMTDQRALFIWTENKHRWAPRSHFGSGVITWDLPFLFRTPANYGLVVAGPANGDKAAVQPLDGFIRTDWLPFPFTMNWRVTDVDRTIRFEAGEPIARIYPYPLDLLDNFELEPTTFDTDPAFQREFQKWASNREQNYAQRRADFEMAQTTGKEPEIKNRWSSHYVRGTGADGTAHRHQTVFRCKPIRRNKTDP